MEFELLACLNQIAVDWVTSDRSRAHYRHIGVDPELWPPGTLRDRLLAFERKPDDFNRLSVIQATEGQQKELPTEDEIKFRAWYQKAISTLRFKQLALELSQNPTRGEEILASFKNNRTVLKKFQECQEMFVEGLGAIEKRLEQGRGIVELPEWSYLCRGIGGLNGGRVTLLTAVSGFGKTTLALTWGALSAQIQPTVIFNMEMPTLDMAAKIYQVVGSRPLREFYSGNIELSKIPSFAKPFLISNGLTFTIDEIVSSILVISEQHGPGLFIIDYDQKIQTKYGVDEWKALQLAIQELEQVAIASGAHIILLSQANESGDPKASKRMVQTAATHLSFGEESGQFFITAVKNRFGKKGFKSLVEFRPEIGLIKEIGPFDPVAVKKEGFTL